MPRPRREQPPTTKGSDRQQLGPNWRGQQFTHWKLRGITAFGPTATRILLLIMDGCDTTLKLAAEMDLSVSGTVSHVRRLRAAGLVRWVTGEPITALVGVPDPLDQPIDYQLTQQAHDLLAQRAKRAGHGGKRNGSDGLRRQRQRPRQQ